MSIHNIPVDLKVGRFCLTLVGEARLWYESLQPIVNDWPALQDQFRQQYSKIGNTKSSYFMHGGHFIMEGEIILTEVTGLIIELGIDQNFRQDCGE